MNRTKILKHPEGTLASERGQKVWLANGCVRAFKRSIAFLRLSCCGLFLAFCGFCFWLMVPRSAANEKCTGGAPGAPAYGGVCASVCMCKACAKHATQCAKLCKNSMTMWKPYATAKRFMNCMCSVCVQYATAISISMGPVRQRWEPLQ